MILHEDWTSASANATVTNDLIALWGSLAPTRFKEKLNSFSYFTGTIKLTAVVQGAPQAAGQLVLAAIPNVGMTGHGTPALYVDFTNRVNLKLSPHLVLDPSKSETYELRLPVPNPGGFYSFNPSYKDAGSYALQKTVFNTLISGTDVTPTVSVCLYMSIENPVFEGLTISLSEDLVSEKREVVPSAMVAKAGAVADALGSLFPTISPYTTVFSSAAGTASTFLRYFGFSKPQVVTNQVSVFNRQCDNYSQKDGGSTAIVLGSSQQQSVSIDPTFGVGNFEDMSIIELCKKRGFFTHAAWTAAAARESLLVSGALHPTINYNFSGYRQIGPMCGVALAHSYWVGDLILEVEIVASVFHRGTILVAWDPVGSATPTFEEALTVLQNTTITISGNSSTKIRFPWKQPVPWKKVTPLGGVSTDNKNGNFYIFVVNPLVSNGSTDPLTLNLYMSSDNMLFAGATTMNLPDSHYETGSPLGTEEFMSLASDFVKSDSMVEFGPKSDLSLSDLSNFGDISVSVKDLTSRVASYYYDTATMTGNFTYVTYCANRPYPRVNLSSVPVLWKYATHNNYLGWFSAAYLGYRGGIRYTYKATSRLNHQMETTSYHTATSFSVSGPIVVTTGDVGQYAFEAGKHYAWTQTICDISPRMDVVAPSLGHQNFIPTRRIYYSSDCGTVAFNTRLKDGTSQVVDRDVMTGSADDAVFCWFLGFPKVAV